MTSTVAHTVDTRGSGPTRSKRRAAQQRQTTLWIWLFLSPTVILFGLFTVYPSVASWWYSLVDWDGFSNEKRFVGLQNYHEVVQDPLFWSALWHTILFMLVTVPVQVFLSLAAALLLNSPKMPFVRLFRTSLFLPVVTTSAIVGVVMRSIMDPSNGPVNTALGYLGLPSDVDLLGSSSTSLWTSMAIYVWKWFGITLIYWLAALQTIPKELYEAASLDGARIIRLFRHITLPLLKPFTIIITLLTFEASLHVFDLIQTMTGGGPFYSSEVVEIYIYRWAFSTTIPRLGYASAAAVIFGLIIVIIGLVQFLGIRSSRKGAKA